MQKTTANRANGIASFRQPRPVKTLTCQQCGGSFEFALEVPLCDACNKKRCDEERRNAEIRAKNELRRAFWEQVPPLYRKTDKTRLKPVLAAAIANWRFSPKGIGFVGAAGAGKTRAAVMILAKACEEDLTAMYLPATELSAISAGAFSDLPAERNSAKQKLSDAKRVKCLLIDDLGKGRLTDRAESELYEILEKRTSNELPTIWTSNSNAQGLRLMFSADRADALIRRLGKEFCTHITV